MATWRLQRKITATVNMKETSENMNLTSQKQERAKQQKKL